MAAPQENLVPPVRQPYSIEKTSAHIRQNLITRSPESLLGRKCGDGRDGQSYLEAIFGSDLGYAFAAQAALRDFGKINTGNEAQALKTTLQLVAGDGKTYVHTDDHHGNEEKLYGGCGANRVARENMEGFGLTESDFQALDHTMEDLNQQGKVEKAVYKGGHIEGAVVLVHGTDFSVKANDEKNGTSIFVATVDLIEQRLHSLARSLAPQYGVAEQDLYAKMHDRWAQQTEIIRLNLAKIGENLLPVFNAVFDPQGNVTLT